MKKALLLSFIFSVLSVGVVAAQQPTGSIRGTVVDGQGAVLPGATVRIVMQRDGKDYERTTDADGKFVFESLAPGSYEISVKWAGLNRTIRSQTEVIEGKDSKLNFVLSHEPCPGLVTKGEKNGLSESDRAEIVRAVVDLAFAKAFAASNRVKPILFVPTNVDKSWLSEQQRTRLTITNRDGVQKFADKQGHADYYSISEMTVRGDCVGVSLLVGVAIKGELEDANMAGGGTSYEFHKTDGRWVGQALTSWVS